ncbi:MAG: hypothetical protein AXA67_08210 [Methylothermaceae bacteria B42]|nr:MAG: hypothetical protein AXA67_08210 [Methylothermaceae bacteria B42]HHJ38535.1 hypothetical protein [Methylothermaceae bacterium]
MTDNPNFQEMEKLSATCGLAATRPNDPAGECPPDAVMAAFLEHRLDQRGKKKMLTHLNRCEDCYRLWVETSLLLHEEAPESAATTPSQVKEKRPSLWDKMRGWLPAAPVLVPALAGAALTVAVVAVLVNRPDSQLQQPTLIALIENHPGAEKLAAQLPEPWEGTPLAFDSESYSAAERAIAAGIWETKHRLADGQAPLPGILEGDLTQWRQADLKPYYQLGQWLATAWILAQNESGSVKDWQKLLQTSRTLATRLATRNDHEAANARRLLTQLQPVLQSLAHQQAPQIRAQFARQIQIAMERLFV